MWFPAYHPTMRMRPLGATCFWSLYLGCSWGSLITMVITMVITPMSRGMVLYPQKKLEHTGTAPRRRPPKSVSKMMCPESTWCSGPSSFPLSFENCIWKNLPSLRDSNCVVRLDAIEFQEATTYEFRWSCMVLFKPTGNPTLPQEITNTFNGPFVSHFDPYANCWLHHLYHICIQLLYPYPPYLFGLPFRGEWRSRNATAADSLVAGRRAGTPQRQRLRALLCPRGAMKRWVVGWVDKVYPYLRILWWLCNIVHLLKFEFYDYNILWDGLTVHGTSAGFSVWATGL